MSFGIDFLGATVRQSLSSCAFVGSRAGSRQVDQVRPGSRCRSHPTAGGSEVVKHWGGPRRCPATATHLTPDRAGWGANDQHNRPHRPWLCVVERLWHKRWAIAGWDGADRESFGYTTKAHPTRSAVTVTVRNLFSRTPSIPTEVRRAGLHHGRCYMGSSVVAKVHAASRVMAAPWSTARS